MSMLTPDPTTKQNGTPTPSGPRVVQGQKIASATLVAGAYTFDAYVGGWVLEAGIPDGFTVADNTPFTEDGIVGVQLGFPTSRVVPSQLGYLFTLTVDNRLAEVLLPLGSAEGIALHDSISTISLGVLIYQNVFSFYPSQAFTLDASVDAVLNMYVAEN